MGNESSQSRQGGKSSLAGFCCNNSLCNNDNNIDNKMNEVQRRNRLAAGNFRSDQVANRLDGSNLSATNNYAAYNGSMIGANSTGMQFKDEQGNTVPVPLHGWQNVTGQSGVAVRQDQFLFMDESQQQMMFQDHVVRDQVKNALAIGTQGQQQFSNNQQNNIGYQQNQMISNNQQQVQQYGVDPTKNPMTSGLQNNVLADASAGGTSITKSQLITPQQHAQNEIMQSQETLQNYKVLIAEMMNTGKSHYNLKLEVVSSATLQKGEVITINPLGLFGSYQSLRAQAEGKNMMNDSGGAAGYNQDNIVGAPDTFTYFGSLPEQVEGDGDGYNNQQDLTPVHDTNSNGQQNQAGHVVVVNDFVIPPRNRDSAEQHRGRHFQIWFDSGISGQQLAAATGQQSADTNTQGYYIKDLGIGFGVFKKMDTQSNYQVMMQGLGQEGMSGMEMPQTGAIILRDNMLINIGEAYIVVNLLPEGLDDEGPHHTLRMKIFGGSNNGEIYDYNINDMEEGKREILMGRTPDCDIRINDKLLSKTQCHVRLYYESENRYRWMLHDGSKGKASTNGTWLYINEDMKIYDGMVFKANQTIFNVSLEKK